MKRWSCKEAEKDERQEKYTPLIKVIYEMKRTLLFIALTLALTGIQAKTKVFKPWSEGKLVVSENHRYLQTSKGTPFFKNDKYSEYSAKTKAKSNNI